MISIVVPVYKVQESLLRQSLNSVICQTYSDMECIIVDDGSPDNCGNICDEYAMIDNRIKVIHTENAGVSNARNIGIMNASGVYILFMDGDDFFPKNDCIENLITLMQHASCDILCFKNFYVNNKNQGISKKECSSKIEEADINDVIFKVISEQDAGLPYKYGAPWGKVIRTDFIKKNKVQFPVGIKKSQDRIFMTRLLSFNPCIKTVDYYGYAYVNVADSICNRYNPYIIEILTNAANELEKSIVNNYPQFSQQALEEAFCYFKLDCIFNYCKLYFFAKEHKQSKTDMTLFVKICKEYSAYIQKCHFYSGMSKKKKLMLIMLKLGCFRFAYYFGSVLW